MKRRMKGESSKATGAHASMAEPEARIAAMIAGVRAGGLKVTPQRLAVVRELAADPSHPTAQELYDRLRPAMPTMSFATVYNTLDALASAGLCVSLSLAPGAARFDPNMGQHHHAVCDRCGLVRDVVTKHAAKEPAHEAPTAITLSAAPGFEVRAVERIYRGVCATCARGSTPLHGARRKAASATRRNARAV